VLAKNGIVVISLLTMLSLGAQKPVAPTITFLGQTYHLGSFNQKSHPQWEFVTGSETVEKWTTLVTLIDRPDARTRPELDRLAQGIMSTYTAHGGRTLLAKTMQGAGGVPFNYMTVAFEEPAKHRYELNFVKAALGPKNAYLVVYGVRITDPKDYTGKAKTYLDQHSSEAGQAVGNFVPPDFATLPRKEF